MTDYNKILIKLKRKFTSLTHIQLMHIALYKNNVDFIAKEMGVTPLDIKKYTMEVCKKEKTTNFKEVLEKYKSFFDKPYSPK